MLVLTGVALVGAGLSMFMIEHRSPSQAATLAAGPRPFVGLHGMRILPLVGWLITRRGRRFDVGHRLALVTTVALAYLRLVALLTSQALRGQPLLAPDADTLTALAALIAVARLAFAAIAVHARRAISAPTGLISRA